MQEPCFSADVADLALHAQSAEVFRKAFMELAGRRFGLDAASMIATCDGIHFEETELNPQQHCPKKDVPRFFSELAPDEYRRALAASVQVDSSVFSAQRRDRLAVYREYLLPMGLRSYLLRMWLSDGRLYGYVFARTRPDGWSRCTSAALEELNHAFAVVAVAEKLHRADPSAPQSDDLSRAAERYRVTDGERQVLELAVRGLTNKEIASVLNLSPNTVRNRLSCCFAKLGVTRRAEAAYVLLQEPLAEPGSRGTPDWFARLHALGEPSRAACPPARFG